MSDFNSTPIELATRIVCDGNEDQAIKGCADFIEGFDEKCEEIKTLKASNQKLVDALKKIVITHKTNAFTGIAPIISAIEEAEALLKECGEL